MPILANVLNFTFCNLSFGHGLFLMKRTFTYIHFANVLFVIVLLACLYSPVRAQHPHEKSSIAISTGVKFGKIFKHSPKFLPEVTEWSTIYELNFSQNTAGSRLWHQLHGYPIAGISVLYGRYGDSHIFGQSIALVPSMTFLSRMQHFNLHYRIGVGLSYITNHFDRTTNPTNNVIGSPVNNTTMFMAALEWKASSQWRVLTTFDFIHYSNAKVQHPNLGINLPTMGLLVKYYPGSQAFTYQINELPPLDRKVRVGIRAGLGFNEEDIPGGPRYKVFVAAVYLTRRINHKGELLSGIEGNFYNSIYDFVVSQQAFLEKQAAKAIKVAPYIGYRFFFGHLSVSGKLGAYVFNPFSPRAPFYSKIGLQYHLFNPMYRNGRNLYAGVYLKAHYAMADYLELGVGYTF